jgi:hypothetical protein
MNRQRYAFFAGIGVLIGSLLAYIIVSDGLQAEDIQRALFVGITATTIQDGISSSWT